MNKLELAILVIDLGLPFNRTGTLDDGRARGIV